MIIACYARTLRSGKTLDDFVAAWMPPDHTPANYPASCRIAVDPADDRRILSVFEVDAPAESLPDVLPTLVHPDSEQRLAEVVSDTELAGVYAIERELGPSRR